MGKSLLLLLVVAAYPAHASDLACMIESTYFISGQEISMRDCMQASPSTSPESLRSQCAELAAVAPRLGGKARALNFLSACPAPAQGTCKNYMRSGNDAYYYQRQPSDLTLLPKACTSRGGTWVPGG